MTNLSQFFMYTGGGVAVLVALVAYPVLQKFGMSILWASICGAGVAWLNFVVATLFNRRAFAAGNQEMLKVMFSGMGIRFLFIAIAVFIVVQFTNLDVYSFAISLVIVYFLLQVAEVRYIQSYLRHSKETKSS